MFSHGHDHELESSLSRIRVFVSLLLCLPVFILFFLCHRPLQPDWFNWLLQSCQLALSVCSLILPLLRAAKLSFFFDHVVIVFFFLLSTAHLCDHRSHTIVLYFSAGILRELGQVCISRGPPLKHRFVCLNRVIFFSLFYLNSGSSSASFFLFHCVFLL